MSGPAPGGRRPPHRPDPAARRDRPAARRPPTSPAAAMSEGPVPAARAHPSPTAPCWRGGIRGARRWRSGGPLPAAAHPRTALRRPCGLAHRRRPRRAATPRARSRPASRRPPGPSPGTRRGCRCRAARRRSATAWGPRWAAASPPTTPAPAAPPRRGSPRRPALRVHGRHPTTDAACRAASGHSRARHHPPATDLDHETPSDDATSMRSQRSPSPSASDALPPGPAGSVRSGW